MKWHLTNKPERQVFFTQEAGAFLVTERIRQAPRTFTKSSILLTHREIFEMAEEMLKAVDAIVAAEAREKK